ncbi:MAG TPA: geranylgeranyl reductase family protein [Ilumatobacter sp.]
MKAHPSDDTGRPAEASNRVPAGALTDDTDVLVVGGGPGGAAAAILLARAGRRVVVVERDPSPRDDGCGVLLTPRSIAALRRLEFAGLDGLHRVRHVRLATEHAAIATEWPSHPDFGSVGAIAARHALDRQLLEMAADAGAEVLTGHEATDPIIDRGFARGAHVLASDGTTCQARAAFTVVADGASSRFGRALGTSRNPTWPYAMAHRSVHRSPLHAASEIELVLDLRDRAGTPITGYGWILPSGDGTVTVGVMMMSTSPSFQVVNPAHLVAQVVADRAERWHLDPEPIGAGTGSRLPLGLSVGPSAGPTYLLVGDAVGAANPLTGAGVESALETGMIAAEVIDAALASGSAAALQSYTHRLAGRYGGYYQLGRLSNRLLGHPAVWLRTARLVTRRRPAADTFIRLATGELRSGRAGLAEMIYRIGRAVSPFAPDA